MVHQKRAQSPSYVISTAANNLQTPANNNSSDISTMSSNGNQLSWLLANFRRRSDSEAYCKADSAASIGAGQSTINAASCTRDDTKKRKCSSVTRKQQQQQQILAATEIRVNQSDLMDFLRAAQATGSETKTIHIRTRIGTDKKDASEQKSNDPICSKEEAAAAAAAALDNDDKQEISKGPEWDMATSGVDRTRQAPLNGQWQVKSAFDSQLATGQLPIEQTTTKSADCWLQEQLPKLKSHTKTILGQSSSCLMVSSEQSEVLASGDVVFAANRDENEDESSGGAKLHQCNSLERLASQDAAIVSGTSTKELGAGSRMRKASDSQGGDLVAATKPIEEGITSTIHLERLCQLSSSVRCNENNNNNNNKTLVQVDSENETNKKDRARVASWFVRKSSRVASLQQKLRNIRQNWPQKYNDNTPNSATISTPSQQHQNLNLISEPSEEQEQQTGSSCLSSIMLGGGGSGSSTISSGNKFNRTNAITTRDKQPAPSLPLNPKQIQDKTSKSQLESAIVEKNDDLIDVPSEEQENMDPTLIGDAIELFLRAMQDTAGNEELDSLDTDPPVQQKDTCDPNATLGDAISTSTTATVIERPTSATLSQE